MKKLVSLSLALILVFSFAALTAEATESAKFSVRVEGAEKTIAETEVTLDKNDANVIDVLKSVENVTFTGLDDGYVSEINGEKSAQFGGWDGWYYAVNGVVPSVGMKDCKVKNSDEIVVFYGDYPCQFPTFDLSEVDNGKITVKSFDTNYDIEGNATSDWAAVQDATVTLNSAEFTTDENGVVTFDTTKFFGTVTVTVDKKSKSGAPAVCRQKTSFESKNTAPEEPAPEEPVVIKPLATKISVVSAPKSIYVGQSASVKVKVENGKGKTAYKSDSSKIASVDSKGVITGKKKGSVVISVTNNKVTKKINITVKNPKLNKKSVKLAKNKTFKIKVIGQFGKLKFTSSKKKVAKVSKNGVVTAKKAGKAVITVSTNGMKLKLNVNVK